MLKLKNVSCPRCGQEMEDGYMYPTKEIKWSYNSKPKFTIFGDEILVGLSGLTMKKLGSYRCTDCKIVTFEYD